MGCKLLLEVSGGLVDRERVLKKMTKTVGQGRIRQDRAQCNMHSVSNLSDKALAYDRRVALKWRIVFIHKQDFSPQRRTTAGEGKVMTTGHFEKFEPNLL
jgi:hypothetical protein